MAATAAPYTDEPTDEPGAAQFWIPLGGVAAVSWLPVLVGVMTRGAVGWVVAAALAVVVEKLSRRFGPAVLVSGLVVASAFVPSGLVTPSTQYLPVVVTGGALAWRTSLEVFGTRRLNLVVARPVLIALGLYLAWAAASTATSIDRRVSAEYLVGIVAVFALAFWSIPAMLVERTERERLLASIGVLGLLVALTVYVVAALGPETVFGRPIGYYQLADLTVGGHATGLFFGRSAGVFLAPLEASILMVISIIALLGWTSTRTGHPLLLGRLAIFLLGPAILLTLDRTAWLAAIIGAGALAALAATARLPIRTPVAVVLFFAVPFMLVFANAVGVNAVQKGTACTANCTTTPVTANDETTLRGGTGLSGREFLWQASVLAIKRHPILGFGPGNNVPAISPYLSGQGVQLRGLTSHSTWLRTAVEMGIPGLIFLIAVLGTIAWIFIRRPRGTRTLPDATQLALAASVAGLIPAMTFESFLLGGVEFSNLYLTLALGLMVGPLRPVAVSTPSARPSRA